MFFVLSYTFYCNFVSELVEKQMDMIYGILLMHVCFPVDLKICM